MRPANAAPPSPNRSARSVREGESAADGGGGIGAPRVTSVLVGTVVVPGCVDVAERVADDGDGVDGVTSNCAVADCWPMTTVTCTSRGVARSGALTSNKSVNRLMKVDGRT